METIQKNIVATIQYTLKTLKGDLIGGENARAYIHGHNNLLAGMENALEGKLVGDAIHTEIAPSDAFGEYIDQEPVRIHETRLGQSGTKIVEGMPLQLANSNGERVLVFVEKKEGAYAYLTRNHPLAGSTLVFDAQITAIRSARDEEVNDKRAYPEENRGGSCSCC